MTRKDKPKSPIAQAADEVNSIQKRIAALSDRVAELTGAPDGEPFEVLTFVQDARERLSASFEGLSARLGDVEASVASEADASRDSYPGRLWEHLRESGMDPIGDSTHLVIDGIVFVHIDKDTGQLTINDVAVSDLRISNVMRLVEEKRAHLRRQQRPPTEFAKDLASAYDHESGIRDAQGDQVRLDDIHRRLLWQRQSRGFLSSFTSSTFREYTREQLRGDLYAFLSSGLRLPDGRAVQVDSGAETAGALWMFVPSLGRMGYVGRIRVVSSDAQ